MLSAASCAATLWAQTEAIAANDRLDLPLRLGNAAVSCVGYLEQLFCPVGLAALYPYPEAGLGFWKVATAVLVLVAISSGAVVWRRRCPYLLVGWLWCLGMLVPVIGLIAVGSQAMADRYTYLTQIGLSIALAWGATDLTRSWPRRGLVCGIASAMVIAIMSGAAWRQTCYWRNSETLWRHTLACTTGNSIAHYNLGVDLADRGRISEAIGQYQKALKVRPGYAEVHYNLGVLLANRGEIDQAIAHYRAALQIVPNFSEAHNNLGSALASRGQFGEAIVHYRQALDILPDYVEAHNNLGSALARQGRIDEATSHYRRALAIKPDYAEAHNNLGAALQRREQTAEAIAQYEAALAIEPKYAEAHNNLGAVLGQQGRLAEAIVHFRKALEINPRHEAASRNLGIALGQRDTIPDAPAR
jgi:tetratricopeptide (TPR) repeat protein